MIEYSDQARLASNPLVSVVMLAYGHEAYIRDAIDGVLMQRADFPIELIIAEDASPDGTLSIALDYQRQFPETIRVLTSQENVGMIENDRRARAACRGEFIALCEGDDYWTDSNKLEMQVEIMRGDENVMLVHSDVGHLIGQKTLPDANKSLRQYAPDGDFSVAAWSGPLHVYTPTMLFRRSVSDRILDSGIYEQKLEYFPGDYVIAFFCSQMGVIRYIPKSLSVYRQTPGSMMNSGEARKIHYAAQSVEIARFLIDYFRPHPSRASEMLKRFRGIYLRRLAISGSFRQLHAERRRQKQGHVSSIASLAAMAGGRALLLYRYIEERIRLRTRYRKIEQSVNAPGQ